MFGAFILLLFSSNLLHVLPDHDTKRLYDDLLRNYIKSPRPVFKHSDIVQIQLGIKLAEILKLIWHDYRLTWNPKEYGGVEKILLPSTKIWTPDIVLYNNANGSYTVTHMTKVNVFFNGSVVWIPPAIYKSYCDIDMKYFPFDIQTCALKFGPWSYDNTEVEVIHVNEGKNKYGNYVVGIDLSEFHLSAEWDLLDVPAVRNRGLYPCCVKPFMDITFYITMRRKSLFYTMNLIIPCIVIAFLAVVVFNLPAESEEKITLCISIQVSLTVFFQFIFETVPPTSQSVPLMVKYLLFTMVLVGMSVLMTVITINYYYRSNTSRDVSLFLKKVFINILPKILLMEKLNMSSLPSNSYTHHYKNELEEFEVTESDIRVLRNKDAQARNLSIKLAIKGVYFIKKQVIRSIKRTRTRREWKYIASVIDRLFLWIFSFTCAIGTFQIILRNPTFNDARKPLTKEMFLSGEI